MKKHAKNPMPKIVYRERVYTLRSSKTEVPDLDSMEPLDAVLWLCANTRPSGYSQPANPLTGMGGAIKVNQ